MQFWTAYRARSTGKQLWMIYTKAIQKLQPPTTVKGFTGMVNVLSMFCPELQTLPETNV